MTVAVLMSAYNGEAYIKQQIDSILRQTGITVQLYVRDDGSTDHTGHILTDYEVQGKLKYIRGQNCGVMQSFWQLVQSVPMHDYYAFADQDDVWLEHKLSRAVALVGETKEASLYIGNVLLSNQDLSPLKESFQRFPATSFSAERVIIPHGDKVLGCTMVWNNALQSLIRDYRLQAYYAHDQQMYFLAALCGRVVFDDKPTMYYRQHRNNVASNNTSARRVRMIGKSFANAYRRLISHDAAAHDIELRNKEFLNAMGCMMNSDIRRQLQLSCEANHLLRSRLLLLRENCCKGLTFRKKARILLKKL